MTSPSEYHCPLCQKPLDGYVCLTHGVAAVETSDGRIEWLVDDAIRDRVAGERELWDQQEHELPPPGYGPVLQPSLVEWMQEPIMRPVARRYPELLGPPVRVLDIGASCRFSVRFLKAGTARLDQVEVSPGAQRIAMTLLAEEGAPREKVTFHTVPAETLPFPNGVFDLVFSSGTIHHTDRTRSLPEIRRVLKPGGVVLMIESFLPWTLRGMMQLRREVRGVDRGTDWPLAKTDIELARGLFGDVSWMPFDVGWLVFSRLFGTHSPREQRFRRYDRAMRTWGGLAYVAGSQCWIAGRG